MADGARPRRVASNLVEGLPRLSVGALAFMALLGACGGGGAGAIDGGARDAGTMPGDGAADGKTDRRAGDGRSDSSRDKACGDPSKGNAVIPYPGEHGASPSRSFTVTANGTPVFVDSFAGASYAHFAFSGTVHVSIKLGAGVPDGEGGSGYTLSPTSFGIATQRKNGAIAFDLTVPRKLVLWSATNWDQLVIVADPLEEETYAPGQKGVTDVARYGPATDGSEVVTTKLQAALDHVAAAAGGGVLYVGPGTYATGSLRIRSQTTVYLAPGAFLRGTAKPSDYPADPDIQLGASGLGAAGPQYYQLEFDDATGSRLIGRGVVDMNGTALRLAGGSGGRLILVKNSSNIEVSDVILRDPPGWNTQVLASKQVTFTNVKVINGGTVSNTDGIDPDSSQGVLIDDAFIYSGDDSVSVKSTGCYQGQASNPNDIHVQNSTMFSLEAALKFGNESLAAETYGITFENIDVILGGRAVTIQMADGSFFHGISFSSIRVESLIVPGVFAVPYPFSLTDNPKALYIEIQQRTPTSAIGSMDGITFEGVVFDVNGGMPSSFSGWDSTHEIAGLAFTDTTAAGTPATSMATLNATANAYVAPPTFTTSPPGMTKPIVSVSATTLYAGPGAPGVLTFRRTGDLSSPLTIGLAVNGTATSGVDYAPLPSSVTILAGASSATLDVKTLACMHAPSTVRVSLQSSTGGLYLLGPNYQAVVTLPP